MNFQSEPSDNLIKIKLKNINDIREFVNISNEYNFNITLSSGKYVVDAKQIIEVFSLDLNENININMKNTIENEKIDFLKKIKKYAI